MGYIIGITCNDIYIYCPKYYRINGKYTYHTKLPAINCKYDYFQVQYGNCNKFTFNISGNYTHHLKFTIQVLSMHTSWTQCVVNRVLLSW